MTLDPVGPRTGRRAELRAKRRKQRRRLAAAGAGALAVLLALVVVVVVRGGGDEDPGAGEKARTQRTVLLQVKGKDGTAVASALLAHDPAERAGAVVLVPPQVLVTVPGAGNMIFGKALQTGSADRSRTALEDLMGVTIDGSWVLDEAAFRRLVDLETGVTVDVDVPVLAGRTVLLTPGNARLTGTQALQFATYLASGEEEQVRLARVQAVLDAVVQGLPDDVQSVIGGLGTSSAKGTTLADVLKGLKKDSDDSQYRSLPVIKIDSGNDDIRFRVDEAATVELVDELLAASVPEGVRAEGNRVLVLNGVGTPGLGEQVRAKLVPAGFVFVGSRNADSFNQCCTQVLVKEATTESGALGARVARALGVPASSVRYSDQIGTIADVVVIVGKDFKAGK